MPYRTQIAYVVTAGVLLLSPVRQSKYTVFELASQDTTGLSGPPTVAAWETLNNGLPDSDAEHRKKAIAAMGTTGPVAMPVHPPQPPLRAYKPPLRQPAYATL